MALNQRERRVLREMERILSEENPSLARRMYGPRAPAAPGTVLERIALVYFSIAVGILAYGLVFNVDLMRSATMLLGVFLPLILILVAAFRCSSVPLP